MKAMADRYSTYRREREVPHSKNPSFSSTLLDAIYRSIDRGEEEEEEMVIYRETVKKKRDDVNGGGGVKSEEEIANFRRVCMIEKWMEKKATEKVVAMRKSVEDLQVKKSRKDRQNLSSSSSDSSCGGDGGGFFSSSEAESFPVQKPKPIRTENHRDSEVNHRDRRGFGDQSVQKSKHEGVGFLRTKSRKIYGELKKVKQHPTSPGAKLAGFLNSIFTSGNLKKHKMPATCGDDSPSVKSSHPSTCSSASSFSRSCLSRTPGKSSDGVKRSVRFFPVSVIVDEDCQPCGHKSLHQTNNNNTNTIKSAIDEELMVHIMEKNRRVNEAARDFLMNYQKKTEFEHHLRKTHLEKQGFDRDLEEEEDDDFDVASCASSDLFELDNLSGIGMERYREELPVYETTHLDTNRAIANGLVL